jgi:hypothetical protein
MSTSGILQVAWTLLQKAWNIRKGIRRKRLEKKCKDGDHDWAIIWRLTPTWSTPRRVECLRCSGEREFTPEEEECVASCCLLET